MILLYFRSEYNETTTA